MKRFPLDSYAYSLARIRWDVFGTLTFRSVPSTKKAFGRAWALMRLGAELVQRPYSQLLIALRAELGEMATKDKAFESIQSLPLLETRAEHFLRVMEKGKVSTNIYLRRVHNFALGMNWLPVPVIQKPVWPKFSFKKKRAITIEEHRQILEREKNPERKLFYELLWFTGASQSDVAFLEAENIDWENRIIAYSRKKTGVAAFVKFGPLIEQVLKKLPMSGSLFPYLRTVRAGDRATEFKQRCVGLGIEGVTLHSYRYAWAERARKAGMPERYAQDSLGHSSKAVTRAYAGKAKVVAPALETYEEMLGRPNLVVLPEVARV